ncbi:MAG TPA: response regulator [Chloroflexia bacterium]|nr:response regulator [Chloroflexia bacterium]
MADHKDKGKGPGKHIMVVNDTEEILELFQQILREEGGYEVTLTSFQPQMIEFVKEIKPDLIISDHIFGAEQMGWQFVQALKMDRDTMRIPIIVCSGAISELKGNEGYLVSKNIGVLYKPFDVDELLHLVERKLDEADDPNVNTRETHLTSTKSESNGSK